MRLRAFCIRNIKEIVRDPLTAIFGLGFPLVLLILLSAIQANIPVALFEIEHLAPGVAVFGLAFMTLFSATLISRDRTTSLLQRLYTTPLRASDYIFGYTLPILPLCLLQGAICYAFSLVFGLKLSVHLLAALVLLLPVSVFYISLGLLCGAVFNDKQVGGFCGALLTNVSAWLSGVWFDLKLVGGVFEKIANVLPFVHAVELERAAVRGDYAGIFPHLWWVLGYAAGVTVLAVLVFTGKIKQH